MTMRNLKKSLKMRHYRMQYNNFEEIERDLKLLNLQKEIDKERIFLSYNQTKESLAPKAVLKRAVGSVFKSALIYKGASKVLGFVASKLHK